MKALRAHELGEPEVLRLDEIADPVPRPREVLIRVGAVGVNPVDTYVRSGQYERLPELPYIPGADAAGTVEAVGAEVTRHRVGDRVYVAGAAAGALTGCSAEKVAKPEDQVFPLPARLSFEQGAAVGVPYATAFLALVHKAQPRRGEAVLVHGASGGVGVAAVQLAAARGLRVAGTAGSERGRELVRQQGAELVLDHGAPGYRDELAEWTGGRGVDVVLEMAAHVNLDHDLAMAARGGRIVVVGCRGSVEINPRHALVKDLTLRGVALANASATDFAAIHQELVEGLRSGALNPVVGEAIPLAEGARAHRTVASAGRVYGKVVLVP